MWYSLWAGKRLQGWAPSQAWAREIARFIVSVDGLPITLRKAPKGPPKNKTPLIWQPRDWKKKPFTVAVFFDDFSLPEWVGDKLQRTYGGYYRVPKTLV